MLIVLNVNGNYTTSINGMVNDMANTNRKSAVRPARKSGVASTVLNSLADVVTLARTVTVATFTATVERANRDHGVLHGGRHVDRFNGWRVMFAQNNTLAKNAEWQLDDVQLLFVWRVMFPMSSGKLFTGNIADGIAIVRGVRADYNRTGHGMPTGKPAIESVSYGAKRFDIPGVSVGTIPANPVVVEPTKTPTRKSTRKTA